MSKTESFINFLLLSFFSLFLQLFFFFFVLLNLPTNFNIASSYFNHINHTNQLPTTFFRKNSLEVHDSHEFQKSRTKLRSFLLSFHRSLFLIATRKQEKGVYIYITFSEILSVLKKATKILY